MKTLMMTGLLLVAGPALAEPASYLKADGMWGHVGRAVKKPGEHVVRVKMLGDLKDVDRAFVAVTAGPRGQRSIWGTVHAPTGKVITRRVEKGR